MLRRFSDALFAQAFGVFQAEFGGLAGFLVFGNDAVPRGQFELLGGGAGQALELVEVEGFDFSRAQSVFLRNLTLDSMLGLLLKQLMFR